ncbi:hypothetical protein BN903_36 [Halorubrum sp. AJ67]|nr:hypothetical protein BN903_36 [Halorubrum sp. AJ67]
MLTSRVFLLAAARRYAPRAAGGEAAGDCPFDSRPTAPHHNLTPPQPRRPVSALLRPVDSLARCSSRSPLATARRHAPPHLFVYK